MLPGIFKKEVAAIYFSSKGIVLLQQRLGKITHYVSLPYPSLGQEGAPILSDDVFDIFKNKEIELVAFLQKAFRDGRVDTKNVIVSLPPKDLIIRFFEMPQIPKSEVVAGINFEMKKYVPFKVEELAFDFQYRVKPKANLIEVLLCGIKQDPLDRYINLFNQLKLNVLAFEPGLFSLFRLLMIRNKALAQHSYVFLEYDKEEANILVAEKGFPYFTRDIKLVFRGAGKSQDEMDAILFRLINEVRVSLDYYRRQFLKKDIDEMVIISNKTNKAWTDNFNKELGLKVNFIDFADLLKFKGEPEDMLSAASKAFGAALRIEKPGLVTLNLGKTKEKSEKSSALMTGITIDAVIEGFLTFIKESKSILVRGAVVGMIIFLIVYGQGFSKLFPLEKELATVSVKQPPLLAGVDISSFETIKASEKVFMEKLQDFQALIEGASSLYEKLKLLPQLMPQGVWLNSLYYGNSPTVMRLSCYSYAEDEKVRSDNINEFVANLKESELFQKDMPITILKSYKEVKLFDVPFIQFEVSCEKKEVKEKRTPVRSGHGRS